MKIPYLLLLCLYSSFIEAQETAPQEMKGRVHLNLNEGWCFYKYPDTVKPDSLIYDVRPEVAEKVDGKAADARPTEGIKVEEKQGVLKPWILPAGNKFISDKKGQHRRPAGNPGADFPFV